MDLINFRIKEIQRKIHQYDNMHREILRTTSKFQEKTKSQASENEKPVSELNTLKVFLMSRQAVNPNTKNDTNELEKPKIGKLRVVR